MQPGRIASIKLRPPPQPCRCARRFEAQQFPECPSPGLAWLRVGWGWGTGDADRTTRDGYALIRPNPDLDDVSRAPMPPFREFLPFLLGPSRFIALMSYQRSVVFRLSSVSAEGRWTRTVRPVRSPLGPRQIPLRYWASTVG